MTDHYFVVLGKTGCGKSSFLNALLKNYKKNGDIPSNDEGEGCTKDIEEYYIQDGRDKYTFYDTPGLDDGKINSKIISELRKEATKESERIKAILICCHIDDKRLSTSTKKMITEFMNCFPLKDFWNHVLIIRTHVRNKNLKKKGKLGNSIKNDEDLRNYMEEKGINMPENLEEREFYFNSVKENDNGTKSINVDIDIKNEFNRLLEQIKSLYPIFNSIKYINEFDQTEGNFKVTYYQYIYEDFNGNKVTKNIEMGRTFIIKEVGKTGPFDEKRYIGSTTKCGKKYYIYQDYKYYKDIDGKKCDYYPYGNTYKERA